MSFLKRSTAYDDVALAAAVHGIDQTIRALKRLCAERIEGRRVMGDSEALARWIERRAEVVAIETDWESMGS